MTAGKPALITQLNEVLDDKSVKARPGITEKRLKVVRDRHELYKLYSPDWSAYLIHLPELPKSKRSLKR